jgi:hypothetical protein
MFRKSLTGSQILFPRTKGRCNLSFMKSEDKVLFFFYSFRRRKTFAQAANDLLQQLRLIQKKHPNAKRGVFLTIEGHLKPGGGFDRDATELQTRFVANYLMPFMTQICCPLGMVTNDHQRNDIPEDVLLDLPSSSSKSRG